MENQKKIINPEDIFPNIQYDIEHALTYYSEKQLSAMDVKILTEGYEKCLPNKRIIGPTSYNYYIIHYVFTGCGYIEISDKSNNNRIIEVHENEMFLICPRNTYTYYPDKNSPWDYSWISFVIGKDNGLAIEQYANQDGIIRISNFESSRKAFEKIKNLSNYKKGKNLAALSIFYECISELAENSTIEAQKTNDKNHIKKALIYINDNYSNPTLTLNTIASDLFINEKYLSRLFSSQMGMPLFQYLNYTRIKQSCYDLADDSLSISDVAFKVGFNDPLYFSKKFKTVIGMSPLKYRKILKSGQ